ncbi:MAG: oxidoreductase [Prolixibacteraceae bacterium]|jgi:scyllo-inositol 2-dehydrogenase (NADP+)|nr:oxidoreductase [Prolixibacteraceae bacterium]
MDRILNVGIVGFGLSGRFFFSPFIELSPKYRLCSIVTSQTKLVKNEYPKASVRSCIDELLDDNSIDLIIVASPNSTHFDYSQKALLAGKHVIVEKPFTITTAEATILIELAKRKSLILAPFQNRRWDGDFLTVSRIIEDGILGEILEFESHFDRYRPSHDRVEWKNLDLAGNGILFDLGPHLIDQALVLFGEPEHIYAEIQSQRINGMVDDNFEVHLIYKGTKVILKAGVFVRELGPRFIVHGRKGSFVKYGLDPQENNLRNGMKPDNELVGADDSENYGILHCEINGKVERDKIQTLDGNYKAYFENVYQAIVGNEELIVQAKHAKLIIEVIEKAYQSNEQKQALPFK